MNEEGISAWVNNSPVPYCSYPTKDYQGTASAMAPATQGAAHNNLLKSLRPC
ncbi:hypothetical protein [Kitasatospora setae]|uniref:hypothetical protein n=1 Tax=Kitasatospora setae TaxID=2066 RepID=UPI000A70FF9C|nr:hypothetical protein [Kitasatospora setae]